jgi:RNA polymerase sigma factor (sigma-70 family)
MSPQEEAKIIEQNMKLVSSMIGKKYGYPHHYHDLCQEGAIALLIAARKFDPSKSKFSTYACLWIKTRLRQYVVNNLNPVHVPQWKCNHGQLIKSIQCPLFECHSVVQPNIDEQVNTNELRSQINTMLSLLTSREAFILRSYYGIGVHKRTLRGIAGELGLSFERIRQIRNKAIAKIKMEAINE